MIKNPPGNTRDTGSIRASGRSLGEENDSPLQYSCLGNAVICTTAIVKAMVFSVVMCDVRAGPQRKLSAEELMLLNCGVGEDSWESLGLQRDPTSLS